MGFADAIAREAPEAYHKYYLKYGELKELVQELSGEPGPLEAERSGGLTSAELIEASVTPVTCFQELLRAELQKVNQFACVKHEGIFLGLRRICDSCQDLGKRLREAPGRSLEAELRRTSCAIERLATEIVHLDSYVRLNYVGFQKLTQKFDKAYGISGSALFVGGLHREPFCNVRFDDILILLGLAWARWRAAHSVEQNKQNKDATWKPPESFVRNTAKYWVKPEKVVLLKTRIVRHLPYLIFGSSEAEQEKLLDPFALLDLEYEPFDIQSTMRAYAGSLEESQLLSSVYFDSPDGVSYRERIHREEGARLVRFRWYGENNLEPDKEIFIERKIHREGWGGGQSAKDRSILPQREIPAYMSGEFDVDRYYGRLAAEGIHSEEKRRSMQSICTEVSNMIQEKRLQPIIRTSYYRCAFQLSTSNEVRISLDTQMSLLNEFRPGGHGGKPWCHVSSDLLRKDEIYRFPFAILEIKLQDVSETPAWLRQTLADIEAVQVHKFSKFQHAMAFLHPDKVPILPHWYRDFREWHERKEQGVMYKYKRKRSFSDVTEQDEDSEEAAPEVKAEPAPNGEGHRLKDMQDLDPKGILANERTLLHYAEKGTYVGALAVALLYQPSVASKVTGGLLSATTAIFYVWALLEYYDRLDRITGRSKAGKAMRLRLDWVHGPLIVGALTMLVLAIALLQAVMRNTPQMEL